VGSKAWVNIMVSYVPTVHGEQKTKPTQHAVKAIRSYGLIPDLVACRCEQPLADSTVHKVALHCQVEKEQIVVVRDMPTIYQVPLLLREQGMLAPLVTQLRIDDLAVSRQRQYAGSALWDAWRRTAMSTHSEVVEIALVGKYVSNADAYMSVCKSLEHASMRVGRELRLKWVDAELLEPKTEEAEPKRYADAWDAVKKVSGISEFGLGPAAYCARPGMVELDQMKKKG
jgi:CTP synthase